MHCAALKLTHIFNTHQNRKTALTKLNRWIATIPKSGLSEYDGFIKTLTKYKTTILNYFKERKNSGFVEGLQMIASFFYHFFKFCQSNNISR